MKKFWCLLLIAVCLLGCVAEPDAPVVLVTPAPPTDAPSAVPVTVSDAPTEAPSDPATAAPTDAPVTASAPALSAEERLLRYVRSMTDAEKIGQLCMFGFSGTKEISSEFRKILQDYAIGNVILYGQNMSRTNSDGGFKQCRELTDSVRKASRSAIPLLISTDVEGGAVTRFKWRPSLYSAKTLGSKNDPDLAYDQFRTIAEGLQKAGINTDLAPCLDVAKEPEKTFLGKRILSSDAEIVANIGVACIEGLHAGGCLSIVKHFPGHGATSSDSHEVTPVVDKSLDALEDYELVPFAAAASTADGVMVGHIRYPQIDEKHIASQSELFITELLRGELGFSGFIMSDDFRMAGIRNQSALDKAAVQFILAGGDLILCGANHSYQKQILKGLTEAVKDGTISQERLNESVIRILSAKMQVTDWEP